MTTAARARAGARVPARRVPGQHRRHVPASASPAAVAEACPVRSRRASRHVPPAALALHAAGPLDRRLRDIVSRRRAPSRPWRAGSTSSTSETMNSIGRSRAYCSSSASVGAAWRDSTTLRLSELPITCSCAAPRSRRFTARARAISRSQRSATSAIDEAPARRCREERRWTDVLARAPGR